MPAKRIRVSKGSCWPCKKRRVKCDLSRPACRRCASSGTACDYNTRLIRWSTRPHGGVPSPRGEARLAVLLPLGACERRALDYFHRRVWPLLSTSREPCAAPTPVALEHRVVLLAACVLSDSHRRLQDGDPRGHGGEAGGTRRVECLAAVRTEIAGCSVVDVRETGPLVVLLFAVVLLYFDDGYVGCSLRSASTSSHHGGVLAILERLGSIHATLVKAPEPLHMLLSEFATTDLTSAVVRGGLPSFEPAVWDIIDHGPVWWGRDPLGRVSLAPVFREMAAMSFYLHATTGGSEDFSVARVREFEAALRPVYAPLTIEDRGADDGQSTSSGASSDASPDAEAEEAVHAFTLVRAFQHAALLYLYRALCGLPVRHALVQQHVRSCLACISEIPRRAKVLNCVIFPLFVAGAHAVSVGEQRAVLEMADLLYDDMRFASIEAVKSVFKAVWFSDSTDQSWFDVFKHLNPHALVL